MGCGHSCGHSVYTDTTSVGDVSSGILKDRDVEWTAKPPWGRTWVDDDEEDEGARQRREERERRRWLRERALRKARRDAALRRAAREPPCQVCKDDFLKWYHENYLPGCEVAACDVTKDMKCREECLIDPMEAEEDRCTGARRPRRATRPCDGSCRI